MVEVKKNKSTIYRNMKLTNTIYGDKMNVTLIYMRLYRPYHSVCSGFNRKPILRLYAYHMGKSGGSACVSKTSEIFEKFLVSYFFAQKQKGERDEQRNMDGESKGGVVQAPWHRVSVGAGKQEIGDCH